MTLAARFACLAIAAFAPACARVQIEPHRDAGIAGRSDLATYRADDLRTPPPPTHDLTMGCADPQTACNGSCVDTATDGMNCGGCGQACAPGETCQAGQCVGPMCPPGQTSCAGACVATATDAMNCGACGNACAGGESCKNGQCAGVMCPPGQKLCGGACADLATDGMNCGGCGKVCAQGKVCTNGACVAMPAPGSYGCFGAVQCLNACVTNACQTKCLAKTSPQGQMLLDQLSTCLENACPSTGGGICDQSDFFFDPNLCDQCYTDAQGNGGSCAAAWQACKNSLP